jgi:hypothetical protein
MQFCHTSAVKKLLRHSNEFKGLIRFAKPLRTEINMWDVFIFQETMNRRLYVNKRIKKRLIDSFINRFDTRALWFDFWPPYDVYKNTHFSFFKFEV